MSEPIDHAVMVATLVKPGADILAGMTPFSVNLLHMAVGISGEAGELIDAIKKNAIYGKPLDLVNVMEELGDLEFYMEGLRQALLITRQDTLDLNIEKLRKRYTGLVYTDKAAIDRADKA